MHRSLVVAAATAALAFIATSAHAYTCYTLFDRSNNVTYRGTIPPVDMSQDGEREREALRRAGQYLLFGDADTCPPVVYRYEGGTTNLSIDNVVGGLTPLSQIRRTLPTASSSASPARSAETPNSRRR